MRNRELIVRKLERVENIRTNLTRIIQTNQPISEYMKYLKELEGLVDEIKVMIEDEPISPNELKY